MGGFGVGVCVAMVAGGVVVLRFGDGEMRQATRTFLPAVLRNPVGWLAMRACVCVCMRVLVSVHLLWDKPTSILWGEVRTLQEHRRKHREQYSVGSRACASLSSFAIIFCALQRLIGL